MYHSWFMNMEGMQYNYIPIKLYIFIDKKMTMHVIGQVLYTWHTKNKYEEHL